MQSITQKFNFTKWPEIRFGPKQTQELKSVLPEIEKVLWVTGGSPDALPTYFEHFLKISQLDINTDRIVQISGEPSPQIIDEICEKFRTRTLTKVIGVGGGSVIDAAKAISAMLATTNSMLDHLEGVGKGIPLTGEKIPFIAIPTTSGTGSEMTTNAVFSEVGDKGYKKSIRHKNLIPDEIWIDPTLMTTCPPLQTACCGLDAFTQLLEAYLSTQSNVITDALAEKGLQLIIDNLEKAFGEGREDTSVRGAMAMASMLSGTCLANAGLGIVHGLAGPLGGFFNIPHGVVCAGLVAKANEVNFQALQNKNDDIYIRKMAKVGRMFGSGNKNDSDDCQQLTDHLFRWENLFKIPKFSNYGIREADLPKILNAASNRNNPVLLTQDEIKRILLHCL